MFDKVLGPKYAKILNEYGKANMRAFHSVLNMPECALTETWF